MWLQPDSSNAYAPRWGHPDGIQVGIEPELGPRGLLRIFTPYLHNPHLLNFVAIEPIPAGSTTRGFSELEHSALDDVQGKRFWSSHDPADGSPRATTDPVPGVVAVVDGVERLTVFVHSERFENGAEVVVQVRFRADRPREVSLAAWCRAGGAELDACVLSATMGNYARLRRLHLRDQVVTPGDLWPGFDQTDFTDHARFGLAEMQRAGTAALAWVTPDEDDPSVRNYSADTAEHWKYDGIRGVQGWRVEQPSEAVAVQVNARWAYWASTSPIPGGPAFENVEVIDAYRDGEEFVYWCEPYTTEAELEGLAALHGSGA
jgi:hypothetical protein